ncbi:MAG: lamin tail domain-containing protein, partial [Ekhidna sp.]
EFVELFNRSDKFINLENWTLSDQSGSSSSFGSFIIRPDSFIILTESDNGSLFEDYGDYLEVGNFPSLNNGGDSIIISNSSATIIHEIAYASSTSGTSTELINPNGPDYSTSNYGLSADTDGGTPGKENSIFDDTPDTTSPTISSISVISSTALEVTFSETVQESTATVAGNYAIDGNITVSSAERDSDNNSLVHLVVSELVSGDTRVLTVNNVSDLSGNAVSANSTISFEYIETEEATIEDIVINEFYASPNTDSSLPNAEFVELFNRSDKFINLENWTLSDQSGSSSSFGSFIIRPDSFIILTESDNGFLFEDYGDYLEVGNFPSLNNGGDSIIISNSSSTLIHEIAYTSSTSGITTELINPNGPDYSYRNYEFSIVSEGGTPGEENSIFDDTPDTTAPALDSVAVISETQLEVYFDEPLDESSAETSSNYTIDGEITVSTAQRNESDLSLVLLTVSALQSGMMQTLSVNGVADLSGNAIMSVEKEFRYLEIEEAEEGDVVINEFYASPTTESALPRREFIELYNRSEKYIDVENWRYSDASDTSSTFPSFVLEPDSFLIITTTSGASSFTEYGDAIGVGSFRTLTSNSDQITISNENDRLIHQIFYDESTSGITTELINPDGPDYSFRNYGLSAAPEGGTPGKENSIFDDTPDTIAPILESISVVSSTELKVTFNEPLDKTSAESIANYSIEGDVSISSAILLDTINNVVQLTVSSLPSAQIKTLIINNVTDLSGNSIDDNSSIEFEYLATQLAIKGDILINEFLADPFDNNDDFVELWNVSEKYINLTGWQLRDNAATSEAFSSFIIRPNEFVIIYDEDATIDYSSLGNAIAIPSLTLNNTDDQIELLSATSLSIAFVAYSGQPDEGISSELINPNDPCISELSYDESVAVSGNTAGAQNSIFDETPDTSSPMITSYNFEDNLTINFSETMDSESLKNGSYQIQGLNISQIRVSENLFSVEISFQENVEKGAVYQLQVADVADCWGNEIEAATLSFGIGRAPAFNELLITEIMADPDPAFVLPDREYIELYNTTRSILNLEGVTFSDESSSATLPSIVINPGSYIAFTTTTGADEFLDGAVGVSSFPSLSNSGEQLVLSLNDELLFSVTYDKAWHSSLENEVGGVSLEMIDVTNPCAEENNWTSSSSTRRGTPGKENANDGNVTDNFPPEIVAVTAISEDSIRVDFNEKVNPTTIDLVDIAIEPSIDINDLGTNYLSPKSLFLILDQSLAESTLYQLALSNVSDCNGNASDEQLFDFALPSLPSENEILLSEILFNPYTNGVDFVELYNNSDSYLNLKDWQLANLSEGEIDNQKQISNEQLVIEPRNFVALSIDSDVLLTNYPKADKNDFYQMESLPAFANTEGTVVLLNQDSIEVERFTYLDDYHYGLLNSVDGVSLERISYAASNSGENWRSASSTVGFATPGYQNSQSFETQTPKGTIEAEPKVFLPGNSGSGRDFTLISYQLETSGQFANVNIYDQTGRLVKKLAEGILLSNAGFIRWDGTNDDGSLAKLGYHIVLFEIYDSTGNSQTLKETVVVGRDF